MSDLTSVINKIDAGTFSFEEAFNALLNERPGILASESGGELSWLKVARERDAARWSREGLPTRRMERWKYTNLSQIAESRILLQVGLDFDRLPSRDSFPKLKGDFAAEVVFLNGHFVPQWSNLGKEAGLSVVVLSELFEECVNNGWTTERKEKFAAFRAHVETSDADRETVFAAMNTSFMQDGILISIDGKAVVRKPILVTYLQSSRAENADLPMISPRVFAHLGRMSEASMIEFYAGDAGGAYFTNAVSDVRLDEGARLTYAKVQSESLGGIHIGTTRVHQKADSWSECYQFSLGSKLSRQDLHISLEGQGAEAVLDGLYLVRGKQHVDNFTSIEHVVPHTTSSQTYKGILGDESRAVFNGRVHIHQDAQKSNAAQLNQNLLLSKKAEVDTKPELEIYADDVKAAHGATIGQIDPEHVFYLQARAIPKADAMKMLARGFAQEVVFGIKHEATRRIVGEVVDASFDQMNFVAAPAIQNGGGKS